MKLFEIVRPVLQSPKELTLRIVDAQSACKLNAEWHSRFPIIDWSNVVRGKHYVCYTAEKNGLPYAVAIWSSPVAKTLNNGKTLELRRLAIAPEAPKNTASRIIALMIKQIKNNHPEIETLISYQDTDAHLGTIYKASNWIAVNVSKAGMTWTNRENRKPDQSTAAKIRWEYKLKSPTR